MGFSRQEYWSGVPLPSPIVYWIEIRVLQILKATSLWRVNRPLLPGKLSFQSTMDISLKNLLWSTRALPKIPMTSVD